MSSSARAWRRFKANRRGYVSLWLFTILFFLSLFAEVISNDKPLLVHYQGEYYFPLLKNYPETLLVILLQRLTISIHLLWIR